MARRCAQCENEVAEKDATCANCGFDLRSPAQRLADAGRQGRPASTPPLGAQLAGLGQALKIASGIIGGIAMLAAVVVLGDVDHGGPVVLAAASPVLLVALGFTAGAALEAVGLHLRERERL